MTYLGSGMNLGRSQRHLQVASPSTDSRSHQYYATLRVSGRGRCSWGVTPGRGALRPRPLLPAASPPPFAGASLAPVGFPALSRLRAPHPAHAWLGAGGDGGDTVGVWMGHT